MNTIKTIILSLMGIVLCAFTLQQISNWNISDDYAIKFETEKAKGTIKGLQGKLQFDPDNLAGSNMAVTVDVNTLNLGMFLKTNHAKAEDFLNVEKYPTITFNSTKFTKASAGYQVDGNLTIKGSTKPVSIIFNFDKSAPTPIFTGDFEINRTDFDLKDKKGVGERIKININVPVTN